MLLCAKVILQLQIAERNVVTCQRILELRNLNEIFHMKGKSNTVLHVHVSPLTNRNVWDNLLVYLVDPFQ